MHPIAIYVQSIANLELAKTLIFWPLHHTRCNTMAIHALKAAQFSFQDSEVRSVTARAQTLNIVFSAAFVRLPDASIGYAQPLRMDLLDASWNGPLEGSLGERSAEPLAECVGRLSGGRLWVGGVLQTDLYLPYSSNAPVRLELRFSNGVQLQASAQSLVCQIGDNPQFAESFAC